MSVESEILRIQRNIADTYAAVAEKGGEVPPQPTSANLAAAVASIQTGITQEELDAALASKQNKLVGQPGQVVGFDGTGLAYAIRGWSNPNLLDNWYFADPVNQRGKTEYTGAGYTIDRWMLSGNASNHLYNVETRVLSCTPTTTQFVVLEQRIEDPSRLAGKTVTFSVLLESAERAIIQIWRTRGAETIALGVSGGWVNDLFKKIVVDITEDLLDSDLLRIIIQTQNCITPIAAKVELGPQQTLAHQDADGNWVLNDPPPNKALELAKCQRYFVQLNYEPSETIGLSYEGSAWTAMQLSLPTEMRLKHPALSFTCSPTIYGGVAISKFDNATAAGSVMQIGVSRTGANVASYFYAGTAGYLRLDADL